MKFYVFSILSVVLNIADAIGSERVVDEDTLNKWGYKTISIEKNQFVKKIEKINKGSPAYYPRFYITKDCYESEKEAIIYKGEVEHLQKTDGKARSFDYRMIFVMGKCAVTLNTDALMFTYDYQPKLFNLLKIYVESRAQP